MTTEEKQKCAEGFKTLTGKDTNANAWNEQAANLLAEMVAKMRTCSNAMDFVPHPVGWRPGLSYIVDYVYHAIKNRVTRSGWHYELCITGASTYVRLIAFEIEAGN